MEVTTLIRTVGLDLLKPALPQRQLDGHKGTFGKLLIVGGAVGYTGAPYLTASAAARTGCGLVSLGVPKTIWPIEAAKCVSAMPFPLPEKNGMLAGRALPQILEKLDGCDVLALGPGLGRSRETARLVWELLKTEKPLVLDADGINALSGHIDLLDARRGRPTVLTPHEVEFARIGGDLSRGDRERAAQDFAMAHGCVLVLKGHRTVTASPEGDVLVNTTGGSGLAKGGSGDVLTASRPRRGSGGTGADGLQRHTGGRGPETARRHPGNSGITEGNRVRIENCVPMIALCLLLCGCGKQTAEPAADLRSVYQEMSGCEMTAEVTCEQSGLEWSATLHGTYVPGGESTVEVLEPLELAGVRAVIREDGWTLEYGDLCLDAGTLTEEAVSPATALARIVYALREGWLLEQNDESREGVPCTRLALDQTGASDTDIVTTVWLRQADGTPFLGEIAVDGETILTVRFTAFGFCDTITANS